MPYTIIQNSFGSGEISPSLLGRTDLAKWHSGASTMRNFFVNYRGGAASRAGTCYIAICKQQPDGPPPRDIPFQFNINQGYALEFGDQYMRPKTDGGYIIEQFENISGATNANPLALTITAHNYNQGDWISISGMYGMTELNGLIWIVNTVVDANTLTLTDLFGTVVNSTSFGTYTSGGMAARIYTVVAPYAAEDLPYLKYTQSADTMTLTCVNQQTETEYPPYDLTRFGETDWVFTENSFAAAITPPTNVAATAQSSTTVTTWYSYVVTAVSSTTGEESIASAAADVENNDIALYAGSNIITWKAVPGASSYNVYKATPSFNVGVPIGSLYGFAGTSLGTSFTDSNITADFTTVPPVHNDPFARGAILAITPTAAGTGYTQATIGYTILSSTGSGFQGSPIVVNGTFVGFYVTNGGENYLPTDTITIIDSGVGTGATATLDVGAATGTYPGAVAYFQQRRVYAATLNNPNTYYMSQPGAYLNMDSSIPVTDSDAIVGTPWAQQINGIQFMIPMPGGLVIGTGSGAWQLTGGNNAAITPADQDATPQAYNGFSAIVPPLTIVYDILYVQAKGSIIRDLSYNFFVNIYAGTDATVLSSHLFTDFTILQWGWAEEPYKVVWAIRDDGTMLSFTFLKEQDVYAWGRHDTQGLFMGVCVTTEEIGQCGMIQGSVPPNPNPAVFPTVTKMWVPGSSCEVMSWPLTANGNIAPTINIQGSSTDLTGPLGDDASYTYAVDVDSAGVQYAFTYWALSSPTSGQYAVCAFANGATGNIAPLRRFIPTELSTLYSLVGELPNAGICVDNLGYFYVGVFNGTNNLIYKYPTSSSGSGSGTLFATIAYADFGITSLYFDVVRAWIWVSVAAGIRGTPLILAFDLSGTQQVSMTPSEIFAITQVSIGPDGHIWAAEPQIGGGGSGGFLEYELNGTSAIRTLTSSDNSFNRNNLGIGLDQNGIIYVSIGNTGSTSGIGILRTYPANANGDVVGLQITDVQGAATYLSNMVDGAITYPMQIRLTP
jgi:Ubiquitin-activating enzyme E1 FCCH domain